MEKEDIFEELIDIGKRHGKLTYDQINNALPPEYFSPDDLEELIDLLSDMGVEVIDYQESDIAEEEVLVSEEEEEYEETEDLVKTYFHSMGSISILERNEEVELAKNLEKGKKIIQGIVTALPLYKKLEAHLGGKAEEALNNPEGDKADEALEMSLKVLDNLMTKIELAERKIAVYGTLGNVIKIIN